MSGLFTVFDLGLKLWTFLYKRFLGTYTFISLGNRIAGSWGDVCLGYKKLLTPFSEWLYHFVLTPIAYESCDCPTFSVTCSVLSVFLMLAIFVKVWWHLVVVLVASLITSSTLSCTYWSLVDLPLWDICPELLLQNEVVHFLLLLLSFRRSLYILGSSDTWSVNIFF